MKSTIMTIRRARGRRGFTLVEMILVMVILATLAAIVVPKFVGRGEQARETQAKTQIQAFSTQLDAFEVDNGVFPSGADGLYDLVEQPNNMPNWRGPYLTEIPPDPWQNEYVYESPGKQNTRTYDLYSVGRDGRPGTEDDITNWNIGAK